MPYLNEQRSRLLDIAEYAIWDGAMGRRTPVRRASLPDWAIAPRATFVTVYLDGELNGCIGSLHPRRGLAEDIASNAASAAFDDPRFRPIRSNDLHDVTVHVAIVGTLIPIEAPTEAALIAQLRVGVDGIVIDAGDRRGTFLPAVWAKLPEPDAFVARLKAKAGIGRDEWPAGLNVFRFAVEEFDRETI